MNAWGGQNQMRPVMVRTNPQMATTGVRFGAWLIDLLLLLAISVAWGLIATAAGVIAVNPDAEAQILASPFSPPSVPPYRADIPMVAVFAAALVVVYVAFATFSWSRMRGLPGQLALSLEVADAETGKNLSLWRALLRALVGIGVPGTLTAISAVAVMELASSPDWAGLVSNELSPDASRLVAIADIAWLLLAGWLLMLLVTTISSRRRQGWHDRAARSVVVRKGRLVPVWPAPVPTGFPPGMPPTGFPDPNWPAAAMPPAAPGQAPMQDSHGAASQLPSSPADPPYWPRAAEESAATPKSVAVTPVRRAAAYLFDGMILTGLFMVTGSIAISLLDPSVVAGGSAGTPVSDRTIILVGLMGGLEQLIYFVAWWTLGRGTAGQRLLGMEVAYAETSKSLSWMDSFLRWTILQGPIALAMIVPQAARDIVLLVAVSWSIYLVLRLYMDPTWIPPHDRFVNSRVAARR